MMGPFRLIAVRYALHNVARFDPASLTMAALAGGGGLLASKVLTPTPNIPPPPTPVSPPAMPDPNSPDALAARKASVAAAMSAGRASTNLTTSAPLAAGGTYAGTKAGG